ncbi:o-succinylbenzoate--CoA ligase [Ornithinicoccus halotolerans]|uniref:o-succinylbenzoate--CoA ligase n=1 Tax=Ornithinicoccus halotolerans TaxID=1748220 RepID=UPI0012951F6D|nr:o-succinylbenzoate--CoA ligase [Ornithinicoccus halotolerans]
MRHVVAGDAPAAGRGLGHLLDLVAAVLESGDVPLWPRRGGPEELARLALPPAAAELLAGAAVVLPTSGSTGEPKPVVLDAAALTASATATTDRLGGPGQWVLALPTDRVAGWQVLVRSVLAGTAPVLVPVPAPRHAAGHGFAAGPFAEAVAKLAGPRRYTSLVPTQVHRLLADAVGREALAALDGVLVGGAALPRALAERARAAGVRLVTTYGMTETAGGCVYDGEPLPGVAARTDESGRLWLSGPVLARGYLDRPELTHRRFPWEAGRRWFLTDDAGTVGPEGVRVLGRVDDLVNTGGVKVAPALVEEALRGLPGVADCAVLGLPDPEWGQRVVAVVVPEGDGVPAATPDWRARLRGRLPDEALPREVRLRPALPVLPSGKVDRLRLRQELAGDSGTMALPPTESS